MIIWSVGVLQVCTSCAVTAKNRYFKAEACYRELQKNPGTQKYRHTWLRCINKFQWVHKHFPSDPWAPASMYMSGELYGELYRRSHRESDKKEAADIYSQVIKRYPKSRYRAKALAAIHTLETGVSERENSKKGTGAGNTQKKNIPKTPRTPSSTRKTVDTPTTITGIRYWSNPTYTRIVIDASREASFTHRLLKKDPSIDKPQRLYVDLKNSIQGKNIEKFTPINDDLLRNVRAGQYTPHVVRVVVDIKSIDTYKIFSLKHPFRVVLDMSGDSTADRSGASARPQSTAISGKGRTQRGASRQRKRPLIVVDPGHGGHDFGSSGYLKKVHEKDIALEIAGRLAEKIRKKLPYEVLMTRNDDRYLTLEERTAIANTKNADLFISIHTNDSDNQSTYGIETYFLNLATDDSEITVAARENATSTKNISDLQTILTDIMQYTKIDESRRLASYIQDASYNYLRSRYTHIKSNGVKKAPFYVLLGARMPAVLIETSFISNPMECKRLSGTGYQDHLCEGIINGIQKYVEKSRSAS
jgi:N-acetylmuramoyl-L-alanine amidase